MVKLLKALDAAFTSFVNTLSPYGFPLLSDSVAESLEEATIVKTYASLQMSAVESPASASADEVPSVAAAHPRAATDGQPTLTAEELSDAAFAVNWLADSGSVFPTAWHQLAEQLLSAADALK